MLSYRKLCKFFGSLPAENTREFEVKVTKFSHVNHIEELQDTLLRIIEKEPDATAYAAFYCLTVFYRNRKDYAKLYDLLKKYEERFSRHISYKHLNILYLIESDALYDYDTLLEQAYANRLFMDNNAGYVHAFAFAFAVICEKQGGFKASSTIEKWYERAITAIEHAIKLDPKYAKYYCTKARILAIGKQFDFAENLINYAISIESSTRGDYALRISEFQYYSLYIQIQQNAFDMMNKPEISNNNHEPEVAGSSVNAPNVSEGLKSGNYVFISYSHKDDEAVHLIIRKLQDAGIKVWYDKGLPLGPNYFDEIADELENCQAMILVLSTHSIASQYVRKELCFALSKEKLIIHANIDGSIIPSGVTLQIGDLQGDSIAKYGYEQEAFFNHLVKDVQKILHEQENKVC